MDLFYFIASSYFRLLTSSYPKDEKMSDSCGCNGPPVMGQFSTASSCSTTCKNALPLGQPSAASSASSGERKSDDIVGMVVGMEVGMEVHHYSPIEDNSPTPLLPATLTTLKAAVSPETPTVDGRAVSSEASMATVTKPAVWQLINGVAMSPEGNKNKSVAKKKKKKQEEDSSSEDTCGSPTSATSENFATGMLLWMRSEDKAYDEKTKRKAEECAEENKKRRAKEGYSPGFIITIDNDPTEEVKSQYEESDGYVG